MASVKTICFVIGLQWAAQGTAQYSSELQQFRKQYVHELTTDDRSPIRPKDTHYLRFFDADSTYRVWADFTATLDARPFMVPTHSGKQKPFREYGVLTFALHDTLCTLHVYQNVSLMGASQHKDDLFLPFNDLTNYESTYASGRYIDLKTKDIQGGRLLLDFNKCYNPWCAYADGFSCPIPPNENRLNVAIPTGEKMFAKFLSE